MDSPHSARSTMPSARVGMDRALVAGATVEHYLLLDTLSKSATSVVHLAHDLALERTVVIKSPAGDAPELAEQFRREARALGRARGPHLVAIHAALDTATGPALVLEHLAGTSLAHRLKTHGPLNPREAAALFAQVLAGLEELHRAQIVHGHITPDNIFITSDGTAKLVDLRLAHFLDNNSGLAVRVGDLLYAAPEQVNGHRPDVRADIYSAGVCLHEAVMGSLPFAEQDTTKRAISARLLETIARATQHEADRRYASARQFRAALGVTKSDATDRATAASLAPRLRRWVRMLTIDAALLATLAGLLWMLGLVPPKLRTDAAMTNVTTPAEAKTLSPPRSRAPTPAHKTPADQYRDLRQAWGG